MTRKILAYINEDDGGNVWEQPFDGGAHRPLTRIDNASVLEFSWSPDGQRLVVAPGKRCAERVLVKGLGVTKSHRRGMLTREYEIRIAARGRFTTDAPDR